MIGTGLTGNGQNNCLIIRKFFSEGAVIKKGLKKSNPVKKPEETKQGKLCGPIKLREGQSGHRVGKIHKQNPQFPLHYRDSTDSVKSWSKKAFSKAQQGKLRRGVRSLIDWKLKWSYLSEVFCLQALPIFIFFLQRICKSMKNMRGGGTELYDFHETWQV